MHSSVTGYPVLPDWASQCPIEVLDLTVRSYNALTSRGVKTVGRLIQLEDSQLLALRSFGRKSLSDVHHALDRFLKSVEEAESDKVVKDALLQGRVPEPVPRGHDFVRLVPTSESPAELRVSVGGWPVPEIVKGDFDFPLESLDLSTRTKTVLRQLGIRSIGDLLTYPRSNLPKAHNFGRKSMAELDSRLFEFLSVGSQRISDPQAGTKALVDQLLSRLQPKRAGIVADRYGLWDGITETLQDIGNKHGLTRERIRQIEASSLQRIRRLFAHMDLKEYICSKIKSSLSSDPSEKYGVCSEHELIVAMADDCAFDSAVLAVRFLQEIYCPGCDMFSRYLIQVEEEVYGIDSASAAGYKSVLEFVKQILEEKKRPLTEQILCLEVVARATAVSISCSHAFVQRILTLSPSITRLPNDVILLSSRLAFRRRNLVSLAEVALSELGRPAHISEIKQKILAMDSERADFNEIGLRSRLSDRRDKFVWVKNSTYGLKAWGLAQPPYIKDKLVQLLSEVQYPLSFWYLKEKVLEVCNCKEQSVRMTLDLNPRLFKRFDNDQYGLRQHY